ncbi:MAG TPA: hypothetical protein VFF33_11330 [Ignavibacteriaceae bacterium]|nr:hypothetical protein [Ignavibacteriaceae bacterium]
MIKLILLILFIAITSLSNAQSFGFGCLGFVGGFGGYSYQIYQPDGLNNFVDNFNTSNSDSILSPLDKFGKATGYRVGLNFFRANLSGFILTTKGFYQLLTEKNSADIGTPQKRNSLSSELKLKSWGIGFDLGTSITSNFSWKVIDAAVLFTSIDLTNTQQYPGKTIITKYKASSNIGYSIGTGFILSVIEDYISLEGLAGYTVFTAKNVKDSNDNKLSINNQGVEDFITNGGFNAVIQLNVQFPL